MDARQDIRAAALSEAWRAVNAIGGVPRPGDLFDAGFHAAIDKALDAIEAAGGRDPATVSRNPELLQAAE